MARTAYVDGRYRPLAEAGVSVEDRGFQFADAIYEVWAVRGGRLLDMDGHLARLKRSLGEIRVRAPMTDAALVAVLEEPRRRNRVRDGIVYLQISRGAAPRDHAFPSPEVKPTLVITAKPLDRRAFEARAEAGVKIITLPDERWAREAARRSDDGRDPRESAPAQCRHAIRARSTRRRAHSPARR